MGELLPPGAPIPELSPLPSPPSPVLPQVVQLKASFQQRIGEAEALKLQLARAEATLDAATSLLGKLSGEKGRWQTQVRRALPAGAELAKCDDGPRLTAHCLHALPGRLQAAPGAHSPVLSGGRVAALDAVHVVWCSQPGAIRPHRSRGAAHTCSCPSPLQGKSLDAELQHLPLHSLLAAAFCTYLPAQPEAARERQLSAWCARLGLPAFDLAGFMCGESEVLTWQSRGLPSDQLSVENAVVILNSAAMPLIIDPSSQVGAHASRLTASMPPTHATKGFGIQAFTPEISDSHNLPELSKGTAFLCVLLRCCFLATCPSAYLPSSQHC